MSEQFHLYFESEEAAKEAEQILRKIRILGNDSATRKMNPLQFNAKGMMSSLMHRVRPGLTGRDDRGRGTIGKRFSELFYQPTALKAACITRTESFGPDAGTETAGRL